MAQSSFLANAFYAPGLIGRTLIKIRRQRRFMAKYLDPILEEAQANNDGSLTQKDFDRINEFYAFGVPAILGESIALLRGMAMSHEERLSMTLMGALSGIFDDFFDEHDVPEEKLFALIEHPETLKPKNANEKLFLTFYNQVLELVPDPKALKQALHTVYVAQDRSKLQAAPGLTPEEVYDITVEKGGVSFLFYRQAFAHPLSEEESQSLYYMGGMIQLGDDIFDVYKDFHKGVHTVMSTAKNVAPVQQTFRALMDQAFTATWETNYTPANIRRFLRFMSIGICRTYVCLNMLEKLEAKTEQQFKADQYERKEMICDMEKLGNLLRSFGHYLHYPI